MKHIHGGNEEIGVVGTYHQYQWCIMIAGAYMNQNRLPDGQYYDETLGSLGRIFIG